MPINPIRFNPIDAPAPPQTMPRPDFSGIASLGASIGHYREQQELGQIMAGAVDPRTGALDLQKAASALAISGRDPAHYLSALAREQALKQAQSHFEVTSKIQQQAADAATQAANRPEIIPDLSGARPRLIIQPKDTTKTPSIVPLNPPAPPLPTPGASLPGGPSYAGDFNPEEAPPYRVAGPMMPPPQPAPLATPAQATPAQPTPAAPRGGARLPLGPQERAYVEQDVPGAGELINGLITGTYDPHKIPGSDKYKRDIYDLTSRLRPGWSPEDYGKQEGKVPVPEGEKLSAQGGKFTQFKSFGDRFDDRYTTGGAAGYLGMGTKAINLGESSPAALAKAKGMSEGDALKAVNYWKDYNILKNDVRHGQFGASLTPSEQVAYDTANVTPNMDPRVIRANLARQAEIVRGAMLRQAEGLMANGVSADKIESYYGTSIADLRKPIPPPEVSTAPGARDIPKVQNDTQAQQMIGYATKAMADGKITYEQAVEDLRRAGVPYPERVLRR